MNDSLTARFAGQMGQLLGPNFPDRLALAVSGGGDSMAMLVLAHDWARVYGIGLWVVTVDHGLRAESAGEAAMVARECAAMGRPHATLRWHWDGKGNLQDAARRARLDLIDRWRGGIGHVLFAHTRDDVAETFLMRLARGSGVEGLSAMAAHRPVLPNPQGSAPLDPVDVTQTVPPPFPSPDGPPDSPRAGGFTVIRPLLDASRAELRHHVDVLSVPYVNDPSNDDPRFDRVRARRALAGLGIDAATLAATATRMARAAQALALRAADVARGCVTEADCDGQPIGDLLIDRDAFARIERDTQLRLLAGGLQWVASDPYRPRALALEDLLDRTLAGGGGTLHGVRVIVTPAQMRLCREYEAVRALSLPLAMAGDTVWDRRWHVGPGDRQGLSLRALGPDGWHQIRDKLPGAPPHDAGIALPAVFEGATLVACALMSAGPSFAVRFAPFSGSFVASLLSR